MVSTDAGNVFDEIRAIAEGPGTYAERKGRVDQRVRQFIVDLQEEAAAPGRRQTPHNQRDRLRDHLEVAKAKLGVGAEATALFQHAVDILNGEA
jgi:hypothetical protein